LREPSTAGPAATIALIHGPRCGPPDLVPASSPDWNDVMHIRSAGVRTRWDSHPRRRLTSDRNGRLRA
jgi:hypothetical protein